MPTYVFYDTETEEYFEDVMTYSMKRDLLSKNPHIKPVPATFGMVTGVGSIDSKTDDGWKEVLSKVAEAHPDSVVGERYGKRSIKEIKTREIVDKHWNRWRNK